MRLGEEENQVCDCANEGDFKRVDVMVTKCQTVSGPSSNPDGPRVEKILEWSFLLVEVKRAELVDKPKEWADAKEQLMEYLIQEHWTQKSPDGTVAHSFWGIVAIG